MRDEKRPSRSRKPVVRKRYYTRLMDLYRYSRVPVGIFNPLIRLLFAQKARRAVRLPTADGLPPGRIERWFEGRTVFFGLAVPRSGSMFLARLLNHAPPDVIVQHEPNVNDYYYYHLALRDQGAASRYIAEYRREETVRRMGRYECRVYGEMNPFLRRHCRAIRESIPSARIFHLVRDGRPAVRSLLSRELYGVNDPMASLNLPPPDDEYAPGWREMSRLEKLCWLWQADNRFIRESADFTVQFERTLAEYDYFARHLLSPLDIMIDEGTWRSATVRPTNRTPRYRVPRFEEWRAEDRRTFERICGEEMEASGYRL